ncbi:MAG: glycosyltransferase family 4 protein [Pirellulales bacterium]|nr:glycosyltransferase family 4 protein [Pirellulales bacterium]
MKALFNGACLFQGGALTVAASFMLQAFRDRSDLQWSFIVSRAIVDELKRLDADLPPDLNVFEVSPARNRKARAKLRALEATLQPDVVFTLFSPAYVRFQAPHLMGCGNSWVTNPTWAAYRTMRFPLGTAHWFLLTMYQSQWMSLADAWVTQTETVRQGLHRRFGFPLDRIDVVSNTCDDNYLRNQAVQPFPRRDTKIRLLCFAAAYAHKNPMIAPRVAKRLEKLDPSLDFEFVLTLPEQSDVYRRVRKLSDSLGVAQRIANLGPVPLADGPELYRSCHVSFLPTLLESFSATYPESMAMGLPIVTSDLGFARDVCRNAALYYDYWDANAAAECILKLLTDRELWQSQIERGKAVLAELPNPSERYDQYAECVRKLAERGRR